MDFVPREPKAALVICIRGKRTIERIKYLKFYGRGEIVWHDDSFDSPVKGFGVIGAMQKKSLEECCTQWPYMALLIRATNSTRKPNFARFGK